MHEIIQPVGREDILRTSQLMEPSQMYIYSLQTHTHLPSYRTTLIIKKNQNNCWKQVFAEV